MTTHHLTDGDPRFSSGGAFSGHARLVDRDADGCCYTAPFRLRRRVISPSRTGT